MLTNDRDCGLDVRQVAHLNKESGVGLEETAALLAPGQVPCADLVTVYAHGVFLKHLSIAAWAVDRIKELLILLKLFGKDVLVALKELCGNCWIHGFEAHGPKYSTERARGILPGRS